AESPAPELASAWCSLRLRWLEEAAQRAAGLKMSFEQFPSRVRKCAREGPRRMPKNARSCATTGLGSIRISPGVPGKGGETRGRQLCGNHYYISTIKRCEGSAQKPTNRCAARDQRARSAFSDAYQHYRQ